jgi:hypothetical protein
MKKHKCRIVVVKTKYETPKSCPFDDMKITLRELSRRTGYDVAYLSKIRSGKVTISEDMFQSLTNAIELAVV